MTLEVVPFVFGVPANSAASPWGSFILLGVLFAIFFVVVTLPQIREKRAHENMLAALAKDDRVVTTGGIHGRVVSVDGDTLTVEVSEKTRLVIDKSAVARKLDPVSK